MAGISETRTSQMSKSYTKSSSLMHIGDKRFEGIWKLVDVLGDSKVLDLPSKVLINLGCGDGRVFRLNELLESLVKEITGDVPLFLYEMPLFKPGRLLCSTSRVFCLTADSIGVSFPPTWFVKTNETWYTKKRGYYPKGINSKSHNTSN